MPEQLKTPTMVKPLLCTDFDRINQSDIYYQLSNIFFSKNKMSDADKINEVYRVLISEIESSSNNFIKMISEYNDYLLCFINSELYLFSGKAIWHLGTFPLIFEGDSIIQNVEWNMIEKEISFDEFNIVDENQRHLTYFIDDTDVTESKKSTGDLLSIARLMTVLDQDITVDQGSVYEIKRCLISTCFPSEALDTVLTATFKDNVLYFKNELLLNLSVHFKINSSRTLCLNPSGRKLKIRLLSKSSAFDDDVIMSFNTAINSNEYVDGGEWPFKEKYFVTFEKDNSEYEVSTIFLPGNSFAISPGDSIWLGDTKILEYKKIEIFADLGWDCDEWDLGWE